MCRRSCCPIAITIGVRFTREVAIALTALPKPGRRVQQRERRAPPRERVAARHAHDRAFVQAEHEVQVVGEPGQERDLRRARVREDVGEPAPPQEVEGRVADRQLHTSSATSTISASFAHCSSSRERVALDGRREAALRRQAELLDRRELRRLVDPPLQLVLRLELAALRRHEPEHDLLVALRQEAQRLEAARPLVVPLHEEPVDLRAR